MNAEHIDPEVIQAAYELLPHEPDREDVEAAIRAADEKRRELARTVPEGQEYAYRIAWDAGREGIMRSEPTSLARAKEFERNLEGVPWVECALLGTWEKLD